jgi:adenosine kinase
LTIYLSGSIAYDHLMRFPGRFADSILPEGIRNLNVSFLIDRLQEKLGGNAGNIAYTLSLLGEQALIVATVGRDFARYREHLLSLGLSLEGILQLEDELTAGAYIITDRDNNQITAFHAAAMMIPSAYDFPRLNPAEDIALIGPSNLGDMARHPRFYKEKGVRYIYDPAQQLPVLQAEDLLSNIAGAWLLVGNDYEISLITNIVGIPRVQLAAMTGLGLVCTCGGQGSLVLTPGGEERAVPAVAATAVLDPTGAGDAYRAGLIKGLLFGRTLWEAACLGATCASFCVENEGTQGHYFTPQDFRLRHARAFDAST